MAEKPVNISYKTAITRMKPSAPMKYLENKIFGDKGQVFTKGNSNKYSILDYGCGRGYDAFYYCTNRFDPYYYPLIPQKKYEVIVCNYVLNVVPLEKEAEIIRDVKNRLVEKDGRAFFSVRRDIPRFKASGIGGCQRYSIPYENEYLSEKERNSIYSIYLKAKNFEIFSIGKVDST